MKRRILGALLSATLVLSLVGCGAKTEPAAEPAAEATEAAAEATEAATEAVDESVAEEAETEDAAATDSIIPAGEESEALLNYRANGFRYGYANDVPYEYLDDAGTLCGFEVDIVTEAMKRLGVTEIVPVLTSWDTYAAELQQGKFDIFGCGVYVTDERLQVMNMCNNTYNLMESIVVRDDSGIETADDLKDKAVGSTVGMLYMDVTQQAAEDGIFGSAVEGGQPAALALDVQTGKYDAAMMDIVMGGYLTSQENMKDLRVLEDWKNMTDGKCSYLFKLDDTEFVKEFNTALDSMKEDGTMKEILEPYGLGNAVVPVEDGQVELPAR